MSNLSFLYTVLRDIREQTGKKFRVKRLHFWTCEETQNNVNFIVYEETKEGWTNVIPQTEDTPRNITEVCSQLYQKYLPKK